MFRAVPGDCVDPPSPKEPCDASGVISQHGTYGLVFEELSHTKIMVSVVG